MKNIKIIIGVIIILAVFAYLGNSGFFNRQNYEIINESKGVIISAPETSVVVKNDVDELSDEAVTPYGQESCQNSTRRSIAVMLAIDAITRPLSGISEADIVFEMPVITDSITRLMAVFGCIIPTE
ncbi:MAG: DUF3048 domain-containing protein, partial [Patescibacteria group bacterium]